MQASFGHWKTPRTHLGRRTNAQLLQAARALLAVVEEHADSRSGPGTPRKYHTLAAAPAPSSRRLPALADLGSAAGENRPRHPAAAWLLSC